MARKSSFSGSAASKPLTVGFVAVKSHGKPIDSDRIDSKSGAASLTLSKSYTRKSAAYLSLSHRDIESGVPSLLAREAEAQGLTRDDIRMIIPDRTLDRRIAEDAPLKIEEADGIARLLRVVAQARNVFENHALADEWLRSPNPALDNHIPIRMARTDLGGREVEAVLGRIAHGVFG